MAMPIKGSRLITVAGQRFRWRARVTSFSKSGFSAILRATVEREDQPASQLRVAFQGQYGYGLLHRKDEHWRELVAEPGLVARCIEVALQDGWDPARRGENFTISSADSLLAPASVRIPFPMAEPEEGWTAAIERIEKDVLPRPEAPVGKPLRGDTPNDQ